MTFEEAARASFHAALMPELVDMNEARSFHPKVAGSSLKGDALPYLGGGIGRFKLPPGSFSEDFDGIVGAPAEATSEIGHRLFQIIGRWIADAVAHEEAIWKEASA
jgi:creatinine amidohydrolase